MKVFGNSNSRMNLKLISKELSLQFQRTCSSSLPSSVTIQWSHILRNNLGMGPLVKVQHFFSCRFQLLEIQNKFVQICILKRVSGLVGACCWYCLLHHQLLTYLILQTTVWKDAHLILRRSHSSWTHQVSMHGKSSDRVARFHCRLTRMFKPWQDPRLLAFKLRTFSQNFTKLLNQKCLEAKAGAKLSQKHGFKDLSPLSCHCFDVWCGLRGLWPKWGLNIARPLVGDTRFGGIVRSVGDKIVPVACNFGFLASPNEGQNGSGKESDCQMRKSNCKKLSLPALPASHICSYSLILKKESLSCATALGYQGILCSVGEPRWRSRDIRGVSDACWTVIPLSSQWFTVRGADAKVVASMFRRHGDKGPHHEALACTAPAS